MKNIISIAMMALASCLYVNAQDNVKVQEPEFVNSYCILTSDSTLDVLPKENGSLQKHMNKVSKWAKIASHASSIVGAAGALGGIAGGSTSALMTGAKVAGSAVSVSSAAGAVDGLAGAEGMDIVFEGGSSEYTVKRSGNSIRLLIKAENNEKDPMETYRIVKFVNSKKDRRIQWMEFKPSLIGTEETEKGGYVGFTASKYGEQSYLLTIPADKVENGEYGIFFMSIITSMAIPVGTFSVN